MCNLLSSDFSTFGDGTARKPAGVEYLAGSVTSTGNDVVRGADPGAAPWNREYNGAAHGYGRVAIGPDQLVCDYMASDISVPAGATTLLEHFTQPAGSNIPSANPTPSRAPDPARHWGSSGGCCSTPKPGGGTEPVTTPCSRARASNSGLISSSQEPSQRGT